jgi:hypothetical protein
MKTLPTLKRQIKNASGFQCITITGFSKPLWLLEVPFQTGAPTPSEVPLASEKLAQNRFFLCLCQEKGVLSFHSKSKGSAAPSLKNTPKRYCDRAN